MWRLCVIRFLHVGIEAGNEAEATKYLTGYCATEANAATACYKDLAVYLLVKYLDGNIKKEKDGKFQRTQWGVPVSPMQPRYSDDFYRAIVRQRGDELLVK